MENTRECKACKGTGKVRHSWEDHEHDCRDCKGKGFRNAPDFGAIIDQIKGRGGKGLRSKRPKEQRAYFVWRMARFHGGKDMTMPMWANLDSANDPYIRELEVFADMVAKQAFGSDMVAAKVWGRALFGG